MKAKIVNEYQNFERGMNPKDSMNIGIKNNPQLVKSVFLKKLSSMGIDVNWKNSETYEGDIYEIEITQKPSLFITYATDKAARGGMGRSRRILDPG